MQPLCALHDNGTLGTTTTWHLVEGDRSPSPALTDHPDHDMSAGSADLSDDFSAYNY